MDAEKSYSGTLFCDGMYCTGFSWLQNQESLVSERMGRQARFPFSLLERGLRCEWHGNNRSFTGAISSRFSIRGFALGKNWGALCQRGLAKLWIGHHKISEDGSAIYGH